MGFAGEAAVDGVGVATVGRSAVEDPAAGRFIRKEDEAAALSLSFGRGNGVDEWASLGFVGRAVCLPFLLCVGVGVEGWCMFGRESLSFIGGRACEGEFTMRVSGRGGWRFETVAGSVDGIISARDSPTEGMCSEGFCYGCLIHVITI